jgi:hypothetical protein
LVSSPAAAAFFDVFSIDGGGLLALGDGFSAPHMSQWEWSASLLYVHVSQSHTTLADRFRARGVEQSEHV